MEIKTIQLTRHELYMKVWEIPVIKLAAEFHLSDNGLRKICRKHDIPLPGKGYWVKKQYGKRVKKTPLPKHNDDCVITITIREEVAKTHQSELHDNEREDIQFECRAENKISVPNELTDPHRLILKTQKSLLCAKKNERNLVSPQAADTLDVMVAKDSIPRAMRILDALMKAIENRGYSIVIDEEKQRTYINIKGENVPIKLTEKVKRFERELTSEEKKKQKTQDWIYLPDRFSFIPTGKLILSIDTYICDGCRKSWSDGKVQILEECLNQFIVGLIIIAEYKKNKREEDEKREREWEEERQRRAKLNGLIELEEERLKRLYTDAVTWHKSQVIRAYVAAVKKNEQLAFDIMGYDKDKEAWLVWAGEQADRLDPLIESPSSILDQKSNETRW